MKLYTEEQVINAIELSREMHEEGRTWMEIQVFDYSTDEVINKLIPIELPTDSFCINCDETKPTHNICMDCIIKIGKENIELPSDEEIDKISFETYRDFPSNPNEHPEWEYNKDFNAPRKRRAFNKGAKLIRDIILNNKTK